MYIKGGGGWGCHIVGAGLTGYLTELQLSSMSPTALCLSIQLGWKIFVFAISAIFVQYMSSMSPTASQVVNRIGLGNIFVFSAIFAACALFLHTAIFLFIGVSMQTGGNALFGAFLYNIVQKYLSRSSDFVVVLF